MLSLRTVAICALALAACACGGSDDGAVLAVERSAIFQGQPSGAEDDAVVGLQSFNAAGSPITCTGTLVANNLVVTAHHCVSNVIPGPFECDVTGELISTGDSGQIGTTLPPEEVSVVNGGSSGAPPSATAKAILTTDAPTICRDDLAFVVLDQALELPIRPMRVFDPIKVSEEVTVVGYGAGSDTAGRHRVTGVPVIAVGPDEPNPNDMSLTPPRSFALGRSTCGGDSGAPAFAKSGAVLGVASMSAGQCELTDVRNFFAQIRAHETLVRDAFAAAGQKPWYEGSAKPGSETPDAGGCQLASLRMHGVPSSWSVLLMIVLGLDWRRRAGARSSGVSQKS